MRIIAKRSDNAYLVLTAGAGADGEKAQEDITMGEFQQQRGRIVNARRSSVSPELGIQQTLRFGEWEAHTAPESEAAAILALVK